MTHKLPPFMGPERRVRCGCRVQIAQERMVDDEGVLRSASTIIRIPCDEHPDKDAFAVVMERFRHSPATMGTLNALQRALNDEVGRREARR